MGQRLNIDGDRAAAAIAVALQAEALVIVTNVPGLLSDPQDANTLVPNIPAERLDEFLAYAQGRMRKKLMSANEALQGGVERVYIGNAPLPDLLRGAGTVISGGCGHGGREFAAQRAPRSSEQGSGGLTTC
jgi:acetylglutamate/LysW-gamma-L-alpha-aminoadipate kinase